MCFKYSEIYRKINEFRWRERKISPGCDHPDKTFYVIRRHASEAGLFSFLCTNLGSIRDAERRGFIPVIDMQNSPNPLLRPEEVRKVNGWELFFEQPAGYGLEDTKKARSVVLSRIDPPDRFPEFEMLQDEEELAMWHALAMKYIHVREEFRKTAEQYLAETYGEGKVLGVLARGTDYIAQRPKDHPVQPDPLEMIERCREVMKEKQYTGIYLATEDERIFRAFTEAFPGIVHSYQKTRFTTDQNINTAGNAVMSPFERNREYFISILVLSECNGLLAGAANGTYGALLLTKGYEFREVYHLGRY